MRKLLVTTLLVTVSLSSIAQEPAATARIVSAADTFLASLDAAHRQSVLYDFGDNEQRARWSNFPTGFVPRGGLSLKQMSAPQREAAMKLLATVLSPMGLEKVEQIRQADDDFKVNGSKRGPGGGGRGGRGAAGGDMFGSDLYYVSFLGKPSTTAPWMLQFGGHHLALNITIAGSKGVLTPTLTGAQPARFQLNGKTIRPLGRESDKALALVQSLEEKQRKQAILNYTVPAEWVGILNESSASARMAEMKADLNQTSFAWSGPSTGAAGSNITAYYRIQGPHLVIEYAPQRDEPGNHVHTMYRDPTNDYGRALTLQ